MEMHTPEMRKERLVFIGRAGHFLHEYALQSRMLFDHDPEAAENFAMAARGEFLELAKMLGYEPPVRKASTSPIQGE